MAFSLFGKRAPDSDPTDEGNDSQSRGLLDRMKQAVTRTRDSFSESIGSVLALAREVDEASLAELETVLLAADIGSATARKIIEDLRQRGLRQGIKGGDELKRLLKLELKSVLDAVATEDATPASSPEVVMMVGVNGTGKTTTIGKLAHLYRAEGSSVLLAAADTFRASAIDQLRIWSDRSGSQFVAHAPGADPSAVIYDALDAAIARHVDVVIVDTAGRLHTKSNLMDELAKMRRVIEKRLPGSSPEILFVLDATTGQNGLSQAKVFHETVGLTGIVLTKLDSTAKGGIVFAIEDTLHVPVRFVGVGEKLGDLLPFDPDAFVSALFA
jgi:fused signal recognition particle receptor